MTMSLLIGIIKRSILEIRGKKVMLDMDLAKLYEVETRVLKQAVRRNIERFPMDFMFELNENEIQNLTSHFVTTSWVQKMKLKKTVFFAQSYCLK